MDKRIKEVWRKVYERKGYNVFEIEELLYKKEAELDQENRPNETGYISFPEPKPIPIPKKQEPSHFFAIRLKWNLWNLIKKDPSRMVRRAIISTYVKKKNQYWVDKQNPSNKI